MRIPKGTGLHFLIGLLSNIFMIILGLVYKIHPFLLIAFIALTVLFHIYYYFFQWPKYEGNGQVSILKNGDFISIGHHICAYNEGEAIHIENPSVRDRLGCSIRKNIRELFPKACEHIPLRRSAIVDPQTYRDLFCMGANSCSKCPKNLNKIN